MMPTAPDELAMPHFEDRLWDELQEVHQHRHDRPFPAQPGGPLWTAVEATGTEATPAARRRHPRRRPLLLAVGTVAAAAAVVAVALTWSPARDSEPGPGSGSDRSEPVSPDVVVAGVLQATEPAEGAIVHATTRHGDGSGATESWWDEVTAAERRRRLDPAGDVLIDSGWPEPPGIDEEPDPWLGGEPVSDFGQCDPGTGLSMDEEGNLHPCDPGERPPQPFHPYRSVNHCSRQYVDTSAPLVRPPGWGYLRMFLQTGDIVVDGTEQVGGRELIRLRNRAGNMEYLVDPETYLPVRESSDLYGDGTPEVTTYERLPRTEENLALLSPPVPEGFERVDTVTDCNGVNPHTGG